VNSTPYASLAPLIGRILIASFLIPAGLQKIAGFSATAGYISSVGLPAPALGVVIAIVMEVLVAGMLLVGFKARWAALALAVFCLVAAFFFHNYWASPPDRQMMQQINFFKNCAIAGGLLFVYAFGPGPYSLDTRSRST
jgi:putative oxidoreductase